MNTSINNYDAIEKIIYEHGIRIETVDLHPELDVMLVVLNTKAVLNKKISGYPSLKSSTRDQLLQWQ